MKLANIQYEYEVYTTKNDATSLSAFTYLDNAIYSMKETMAKMESDSEIVFKVRRNKIEDKALIQSNGVRPTPYSERVTIRRYGSWLGGDNL